MGNNSRTISSSSEVEEEIERVDHISDLPESILHDILCRLSMKDVTRMSTISKSWNRVHSSSPDFHFCVDEYLEQRGLCNAYKRLVECDLSSSEMGMVDEFMNVVDHHLLRFSDQNNGLRMRRFKLVMYGSYDGKWSDLVDSWVKLALEKDVKYLGLWLSSLPDDPYNDLSPKFVHHVMDKDLFGCGKKFGRLRHLDLDGVSLSENLIDNIICTCPCIVYFKITRCKGLKALTISRLAYLKSIVLVDHLLELEWIHINAPSLQHFYINHSRYDAMPQCSYNLDSCQNLRRIELIGSCLTDTSLESFISRFRRLKYFTLFRNWSERISISSPLLKEVNLLCCWKMAGAEINSPNLSTFVYGGSDILTFPRLSLKNTRCISHLSLSLTRGCPIHTLWFTKLREFVANLSHIKDIAIAFEEETEVTFDIQELEKITLPRLPQVGHIWFIMVPSTNDFTTLLDGLLWSCRPKAVSVKWDSNVCDEFKKLVHTKLLNSGNPNCCISNNVKCWKHFVKNVKIASFRELDSSIKHLRRKQQPYPSTVQETQFTFEWCIV